MARYSQQRAAGRVPQVVILASFKGSFPAISCGSVQPLPSVFHAKANKAIGSRKVKASRCVQPHTQISHSSQSSGLHPELSSEPLMIAPQVTSFSDRLKLVLCQVREEL
jgi:hypothetical protein